MTSQRILYWGVHSWAGPRVRRLAAVALCSGAPLLTACGGDGPSGLSPADDPVPASLTLSRSSLSFSALGEAAQLVANVRDEKGQIIAGAAVTWTSSLSSVASVDRDGLVTAQRNGTADIYARAGDASASVQVVVDQVIADFRSDGDGQIGAGGAPILHPLVVELRDARGHGIAGKSVAFSVLEGGGRLDPGAAITDDDGVSISVWTLGPSGTPQRAMAAVEGNSAIFEAQAVEVDLSDIVGVSQNDRFLSPDTLNLRVGVSEYPVPDDSIRWTSSLDGELGRGPGVTLTGLTPGTHTLQVSILGAHKEIQVRVFSDLLELYRSEPSQAEVERIQGDFDLQWLDGTGEDEIWAPYGFTFDQSSTDPSRLAVIAKLDVLRRQRFSIPPPSLGEETSFYGWMRRYVGTIQVRLDCSFNRGGGGMISTSRTMSVWDGRSSTDCKEPFQNRSLAPYVSPAYLFVHEARHSDPGDPGHVTCPNGIPGDAYFEDGGGYAMAALFAMWVYKYSLVDPPSIREDAKDIAAILLNRICSAPTHSDPGVQALIDEVLGGQ